MLAERIRLAVCETPLEFSPACTQMTVSIGVAGTVLPRDEADLKAAAERCSKWRSALYRASRRAAIASACLSVARLSVAYAASRAGTAGRQR